VSGQNGILTDMNEARKIDCAFCLLGPPASGKGTIASFLKTKFDCETITPGDIYRRLRDEDSELGVLVKEALKDGGYCPDELTNAIITKEALDTLMRGKSIILDGFPRTLTQFQYLNDNFSVKVFLHLDAPYEMLMQAATNRIQCAMCDKTWSKTMPEDECCDCRPKIWKERFDDSAEMYPKRFETYQNLSAPIIDAVKMFDNYKKIQNLGNPQVNAQVLEWLEATNPCSCR